MTRETTILAGLAVVALGGLAGCGAGTRQGEEASIRVPVATREVTARTVEDLVRASGVLRAPELATLTVETAGVLEIAARPDGRRLEEGDRVRAGDLVARITGKDVEVAARLAAAEQSWRSAVAELEAKQALFEQGLISRIDLSRAETAAADARVELDRARLTLTRAELRSPIDGAILRLARTESGLPAAAGQKVPAGFLVAEIGPIDRLVADVDLAGEDALRVRRGLEARVIHPGLDRVFAGRVARVAPRQDEQTRASRVEVGLANAGLLLRPGMIVTVELVLERHEDVPVVPRDAVTERRGRPVVYVLEAQKADEREVRLGLGDDRVVEILEGVSLGEPVIVRGLETLTDGTPVRDTGA
ncbi:MAG: efflux RND transporter periplasmic adaptor subunit [Acidobacteria bacterium]|nr:MAG: efflux RND transporter periplasmic adaptor subunit [Acidobacteriota bacterium]